MGGAESKRVQASRQVIWLRQFSKLERLTVSDTLACGSSELLSEDAGMQLSWVLTHAGMGFSVMQLPKDALVL